jgi:hypothetical protein
MDYYKNKFIKYKMKYLNLQSGGGNKFLFYIDSSILSPLKEEITGQFISKFHIKQGVEQDHKDPKKRAQLMAEIPGILAVKGYPNEHTLLLDIIRKNNFIVERQDPKGLNYTIVDNCDFNIEALQLREYPQTNFHIHKDILSTQTYKRKIDGAERELRKLKEREEREKREREEQERKERKEQELSYLNNLYEEIVLLISQIQHKSSTEIPQQLQNIIQNIDLIKRLEDSIEKKKVLFHIATDYILNSFFNDSIEKVQRDTVPPLELTRKIQELSRRIYDQLGLLQEFHSEVKMVTEYDEDVAFDTQLNLDFEDAIKPPTTPEKIKNALVEIMRRRSAHQYRQ